MNLRADRLNVRSDASDQPAAADWYEHGLQRRLMLPQDLHPYRALPGNHIGVVKGMHKRQPVCLL
ncbi:hypothetical protein D3C87_1466400 [compost metagenome]